MNLDMGVLQSSVGKIISLVFGTLQKQRKDDVYEVGPRQVLRGKAGEILIVLPGTMEKPRMRYTGNGEPVLDYRQRQHTYREPIAEA